MTVQTRPPMLVFDLDGTLVDSAQDISRTLDHLMVQEGLDPIGYDNIRKVVGKGARVMLQRAFAINNTELADSDLDRLFDAFLAHYEDHIADHTVPFDGVLETMVRFEKAGWRFAVCTNKLERLSVKLLKELKLDHRFETICGPDTVANRKPDPRHLIDTLKRAGGDPKRSIMIGDSISDIDAAKSANIPVVAVDFGYTDVPVDQLGPDAIISSFGELWDAVQRFPHTFR